MKWYWIFQWWFWKYIFMKEGRVDGIFKTALCRAGGHKCGVVYYNIGGTEPDMHCLNCGEDLG